MKFTFKQLKVSKYGVIPGPYFPVFGVNTGIYSVNLRIQSEYKKMRTRNNSVFELFSRSTLAALFFAEKQRSLPFLLEVKEHQFVRINSLLENRPNDDSTYACHY